MNFKNNDDLKKAVVDGVLNCKGQDLNCPFNIDIDAHIIVARDINANNINAGDIVARNIVAGDIDAHIIVARDINAHIIVARDINARDIKARNIDAWDINARDINARDINARDIDARDIDYYAVCFAYKDIVCNDIKGRRHNSKHFVLDGKITTREKTK